MLLFFTDRFFAQLELPSNVSFGSLVARAALARSTARRYASSNTG